MTARRAAGGSGNGSGSLTSGSGAVMEPAQPLQAPNAAPGAATGVQTLIVHGFPSPPVARALSPNGRAHWRKRQECKEIVEANVSAWVRIQRIQPVHGRVSLRPTFVFPVKRRRDDDNLATGVMKAVRDTLVKFGILEDDSTDHVVQAPVQVLIEKGQRRLEVVIEPLEV